MIDLKSALWGAVGLVVASSAAQAAYDRPVTASTAVQSANVELAMLIPAPSGQQRTIPYSSITDRQSNTVDGGNEPGGGSGSGGSGSGSGSGGGGSGGGGSGGGGSGGGW